MRAGPHHATGFEDRAHRRIRLAAGRSLLAQDTEELLGHFLGGLESVERVGRGGFQQEAVERLTLGQHRVLVGPGQRVGVRVW